MTPELQDFLKVFVTALTVQFLFIYYFHYFLSFCDIHGNKYETENNKYDSWHLCFFCHKLKAPCFHTKKGECKESNKCTYTQTPCCIFTTSCRSQLNKEKNETSSTLMNAAIQIIKYINSLNLE
jgi:hypothetical protein